MVKDFSKGKIYKLTAGDLTYYGSTIQTLERRLNIHKSCNDCSSQKLFESGEEVKIHLVENYPCKSKKELRDREGYYQKNFECVNEKIAGRTKQEWRDDNKDYMTEYCRERYINKKGEILEKMKQYYENHKDEILEYHKQYREDNKKTIAEYQKQYRENNKDKIKAHAREKIQCECGAVVGRGDIARHRESQKHKNYIDSL